jgi:Ca-activated chloride channel family protein
VTPAWPALLSHAIPASWPLALLAAAPSGLIRWGAPRLLWLLLAVPAAALLMLAGAWLRGRRLARLAEPDLIPRLTDSRSPRLVTAKAVCLLAGLTLLIVALARPQWGEKLQVYKGRGIDIVIALDASKSMLATDVAPNRLTRAKSQIAALLDNLSTNRVGIVAFAGDAQVMCPLTTDVEAAKLFLDIIDPDHMPHPGTNIEKAVETSAALFDPGHETSRALVLVTDGETLEGDPAAAVQAATEAGVRLFAVGVGTAQGSTIPESEGGGTHYKKDEHDQIVVSRLAERLLLVMAKATDGRYFRSESINLNDLVAALDQMQKHSIGGGEYVEFEERYQPILLLAFVLCLAGVLISDRRGAWFAGGLAGARWMRGLATLRVRRPGARSAALALLLGALLAAPARAGVGASMRRGLALERQGKYADAIKAFEEALVLEPDNVRIHYDIGRARYELNQHADAVDHFQLGLLSKSRALRANSLYNLGETQYRQKQLDEAIASYTQSLLLRPDDLNAKQNLEYCWKMKAQQQQQPDSSHKQPPPQKQQQQKQPQPQPSPQPAQAQAGQGEKGAISKEQADRMLQALASKERQNLKNQPKPPQPQNAGGKDW